MEAKLKEYRALRRRKEIIDKTKEKLQKSKEAVLDFLTPKFLKDMDKDKSEEVLLLEEEEKHEVEPHRNLIMEETIDSNEVSETESVIEESQESWKYCMFKWSIYSLIWLALYLYFLSIQFGAVFFVISLLIGIYLNTRTKPKKKGEISAYSVFNKDCTSIEGTLTAEKLQREMLYGGRLF